MLKLPVQISNILKVSKSIELRYRYLGIEIEIGIKTRYRFFKMGIIVRYQKVLIPKFGIEMRYRKVSIPLKGIDSQHYTRVLKYLFTF